MLPHKVKVKSTKSKGKRTDSRLVFYFLLFTFALASSCTSKPTDLRTLIPADSLVYLESNDLGAVMKTITDRPAFREAAKTVPDFSALNGVRLAVAVTGFETKEQPVTAENSVLNFQPRFVAVLETNAWNFQATSFTENQLGEFINNAYGGEVLLETSDKHDGKYFVWKANDGRKAYALVLGSLIFFGNDETAIEKSLVVKRGEADAISKNPKITTGDRLAFGYVSPDGVAQIANITGLSMAKQSSDEGEVQSFVARVLPELLRNAVADVSWTSTGTEMGVEDKFAFGLKPNVANVFTETLTPSEDPYSTGTTFLPGDLVSVTQYNLKDPQVAWRSVVLTTETLTDALSGKMLVAFSGGLFEPYGVADPELFLRSIKPQILTARFDSDGEKTVVIATPKDLAAIKSSIVKDIDFTKPPEKVNFADVWKSTDGEFAAAFVDNYLVLGNAESVLKCLDARINYEKHPGYPLQYVDPNRSVSITFARDKTTIRDVVGIVAENKDSSASPLSSTITETAVTKAGLERRSYSEFGFFGWLITQFVKED